MADQQKSKTDKYGWLILAWVLVYFTLIIPAAKAINAPRTPDKSNRTENGGSPIDPRDR